MKIFRLRWFNFPLRVFGLSDEHIEACLFCRFNRLLWVLLTAKVILVAMVIVLERIV